MTLLLQVSDPHFGTARPAVVEALVRLALACKPQVLLLSGDITQRATRAQFAAALAFVQRLRVPHYVAVPGNHDIRTAMRRPCRPWGAAGVDLIVGGHIHLHFVLPLASGWAVQAGTAVSRRVRPGAGNSVNLIHIDAGAAERGVVERWDHDPAQDGFVLHERHRLLVRAEPARR